MADQGAPVGLEPDYVSLRKAGKADRDLFQLHLMQVIENAVGLAATANVSSEPLSVDGHDICRVHVEPSGYPVYAQVTKVDQAGNHQSKHSAFFVRLLNGTREISSEGEIQRYVSQRWGSPG